MTEPTWPALPAGADPVAVGTAVRRAHDAFLSDGACAPGLRSVVGASWRRSSTAGVDPETSLPPVELTGADLRAYRDDLPVAAIRPVVVELLGGLAEDGEHLVAITDATGRLLWVEGCPTLLSRAERMRFVEGAAWDEGHAGTNAPGTAIALDRPVQIFGAEHFSRLVQPWSCAAAPIRHPHTGELLGVLDLTGGDHVATAAGLALVRATVRAAETELARILPVHPRLWTPQAAEVRVEVLGRDEGVLSMNGDRQRLSRRHSEILAILLEHPRGLSGEQLGLQLHGDDANPITTRSEISRLRRLLGPEVLASRPYTLTVAATCDAGEVSRLLDRGDAAAALARYHGPVLPSSNAPGIVEWRHRLEQRLRAAVLASTDADLLRRWTAAAWGADDLEAWQRLAATTPDGATRTYAGARTRALAIQYGLDGQT